MKFADVLGLPSMASGRVVAGKAGDGRQVLWSHVVDVPDPVQWMRPGFLLLTTGYSWPLDETREQRQIADLASAGVAGVIMAVPKFVEHFSKAARAQADASQLPLIEIPFEVPFAQLMEELHRSVVMEPYAIIERSEQIHRALTRAAARDATLDDLARELSSLIARSVTFEDPDGKLLASASIEDQLDDIRRETIAAGKSPLSAIGILERSTLNRRIRATEKPLRIGAVPEIGLAARVVCPVRVGSELVGAVWIIEGREPLSELDHRAAEHAALVAAIHIAHQRDLTATQERLGYASFLSLLETEPGREPIADERVRLLGFDTQANYRVGIVHIPEDLPLDGAGIARRERVAQAVRNALRHAGREALVTMSLNLVPFLLPPGVKAEAVRDALGDPSLSIVLGREQSGAQGARSSYREALSLVSYRDRPSLCTYDELLVPRVIMGDAAARETFLDGFFRLLRERKNGKELAKAMLALARHGFRFRAAAEALCIHPNTLRYRLERVSEILGINLGDIDVQFRLQLAARLLDAENREW
ncbi:MAG: PucR family transcriptional regulator ligand-binding domain-containing protein [Candidatus Eremiobacteraeota bacterium]|nr:PucR family transcriptional regulator ligand-binding domain-containing protein [Candidatus Eremiobacteraeota bacterium]